MTTTILLVMISLLILGGFLLLVFSICRVASDADDNAEEILAQLKETDENSKPTKKNSP
jgi:hypothetical protein